MTQSSSDAVQDRVSTIDRGSTIVVVDGIASSHIAPYRVVLIRTDVTCETARSLLTEPEMAAGIDT